MAHTATEGAGVVTINGLRVAIIGQDNNGDIVASEDADMESIDILLSPQWPKGITRGVKIDSENAENKDSWGSQLVTKLARRICPRYHIAVGQNLFFKRSPFQSESGILTRFVGLANVSEDTSPSKKFLHALALQAMSTLPWERVTQPTADTTENPYILLDQGAERPRKATASADDRFSGTYGKLDEQSRANRDDRPRKRTRNDDRRRDRAETRPKQELHPLLQRMDACWFCLASPKVEKHLIISIGDESYVAMAKGPLTDENVVLLPISHCSSLLDASSEARQEIERVKEALEKAFASKGLVPIFTERFGHTRGNHHAHIQVVGVKMDLVSSVFPAFEAAFKARHLDFTALPGWMAMGEVVRGGPYFYLEIPGVGRFVSPIGDARLPVQIGREDCFSRLLVNYVCPDLKPTVLANVMGLHSKADWKESVGSVEEEKRAANNFRQFFKKLDPFS